MTKREVVWLLIRIAGLWFLWQATENVFSVISSFMVASSDPQLSCRSAGLLLPTVVRAGVYLIVGLYCLIGGNVFFQLLNRQPDTKDN